MKKLIILLTAALLILCGCGQTEQIPSADIGKTEPFRTEITEPATETLPPETAKQSESETTAETLPTDDGNTLSAYAEKDYLLPFESYSWEREYKPEFIVLHFTSNVVESKNDPHDLEKVKEIFASTNVSSHYIIDRDGGIKCFIPENYAAWHAGAGTFGNDEKYTNKMNKYSIGIEMLAVGSKNDMQTYLTPAEYDSVSKEHIGFTDEQYASLKLLIEDICQRYDIPFDREHIIGHDEYNPKKNDPGELFDYGRLFG